MSVALLDSTTAETTGGGEEEEEAGEFEEVCRGDRGLADKEVCEFSVFSVMKEERDVEKVELAEAVVVVVVVVMALPPATFSLKTISTIVDDKVSVASRGQWLLLLAAGGIIFVLKIDVVDCRRRRFRRLAAFDNV